MIVGGLKNRRYWNWNAFYQESYLEGIEEQVLDFFHFYKEITTHHLIYKFSISRATAQRWLNDLIEKGLIQRIGKTRNSRYVKVKGFFLNSSDLIDLNFV